jgi:hypothetical protein
MCLQEIPAGMTYLPPHVDYWAEAKKFQNECLNTLWCEYLLPYLAYYVQLRELTPQQYQHTAEGYVRKAAENTVLITTEELRAVHNYQRGVVDVALKSLDAYIRANTKTCTCLTLYKPLGISCCTSCGNISCGCSEGTIDDSELDYLIA